VGGPRLKTILEHAAQEKKANMNAREKLMALGVRARMAAVKREEALAELAAIQRLAAEKRIATNARRATLGNRKAAAAVASSSRVSRKAAKNLNSAINMAISHVRALPEKSNVEIDALLSGLSRLGF